MHILYATSNDRKFEEARHVLHNWTLERVNLDIEEIQGSPEEIASHKAQEAAKIVGKPVIVEDVSMSCTALNGLPGPYVKDFLKALGEEGLADLVHRYKDHSATVGCSAAFCKPGGTPIVCTGELEGTIVPPRGKMRHGSVSWNPIFLPKGFSQTMGELSIEEHAKISMRKIALEKLAQQLGER